MTFKTLLTMIIVAYVLYYAYQIIHDLFFAKGSIVQDELEPVIITVSASDTAQTFLLSVRLLTQLLMMENLSATMAA